MNNNPYPKIITSVISVFGVLAISWSLTTAWVNPSALPVQVSGGISVSPLGNIGIGITAPTQKLNIAGNVRWTGSLTSGTVSWASLSTFPSPCVPGTFISIIGDSVPCVSASWGGLINVPAGFADRIDDTTNGVSSLSSGLGIANSPLTITTTGSVNVDTSYTQRRVTGTCVGGAISGVNVDGTVTCKTLPTPLPCTWGLKTHTSGAICHSGGIRSQCLGSPNYDSYWLFQCNANGTWSYYPSTIGVTNSCGRPAPYPQCI